MYAWRINGAREYPVILRSVLRFVQKYRRRCRVTSRNDITRRTNRLNHAFIVGSVFLSHATRTFLIPSALDSGRHGFYRPCRRRGRHAISVWNWRIVRGRLFRRRAKQKRAGTCFRDAVTLAVVRRHEYSCTLYPGTFPRSFSKFAR